MTILPKHFTWPFKTVLASALGFEPGISPNIFTREDIKYVKISSLYYTHNTKPYTEEFYAKREVVGATYAPLNVANASVDYTKSFSVGDDSLGDFKISATESRPY